MTKPTSRGIIGSHLIQTVHTQLFDSASAIAITSAFTSYEFKVVDIGHHISILTGHEYGWSDWECACLYLENDTLHIKALDQRWWLLFSQGDKHDRYEDFWHVADRLEENPYPIFAGTVGELNLHKAFQEQYGRDPTAKEWEAIEEAVEACEAASKGQTGERRSR